MIFTDEEIKLVAYCIWVTDGVSGLDNADKAVADSILEKLGQVQEGLSREALINQAKAMKGE